MSLAEQFHELFQGRDDAYGLSVWSHRADGWTVQCVRHSVTVDLFRQHLDGETDLGIYPVRPNNTCRWGCVDIDTDDHPLAVRLAEALREMGFTPWIEKSNSKGYHVWVFANDWVPAAHMRRTLLVACEVIDYDPKEVNPKRETGDILGNFVRLPYPGNARDEKGYQRRYVLAAPAWPQEFASQALERRSDPSLFALWSQRYITPKRKKVEVRHVDDVPPLLKKIIDEGPHVPSKEQGGRSAALYRVACLCREHGLPMSTGLAVIMEVDARHLQKYSERADAELRYMETIERAYS